MTFTYEQLKKLADYKPEDDRFPCWYKSCPELDDDVRDEFILISELATEIINLNKEIGGLWRDLYTVRAALSAAQANPHHDMGR